MTSLAWDSPFVAPGVAMPFWQDLCRLAQAGVSSFTCHIVETCVKIVKLNDEDTAMEYQLRNVSTVLIPLIAITTGGRKGVSC